MNEGIRLRILDRDVEARLVKFKLLVPYCLLFLGGEIHA